MANLKEIRTRINTVVSTRQITSAMKMVSAAKLRRAQDSIITLKPYSDELMEILDRIRGYVADTKNPFTEKRPVNKVLIILVTSNRGLCGSFNLNSSKKVIELLNNEFSKQFKNGNTEIICVGKKGADYLKIKGYKVSSVNHELLEKPDPDKVFSFIESTMNKFESCDIDHVELVFNKFKNAAVQRLVSETFLPLYIEPTDKDEEVTNAIEYIFEPDKDHLIRNLIPLIIKILFYSALLESSASEHGARMTAMHKASDNAEKLIRELKLNYNKARQSLITNELIEIVSGADALRK